MCQIHWEERTVAGIVAVAAVEVGQRRSDRPLARDVQQTLHHQMPTPHRLGLDSAGLEVAAADASVCCQAGIVVVFGSVG